MIRYEGRRTKAGAVVTANGNPLEPRLDLRNHSPTGFEWGYCGSGAAQLALAILADHLEDDDEALILYQRFKWTVITSLPRKGWKLNSADIEKILHAIREQEARGGPT